MKSRGLLFSIMTLVLGIFLLLIVFTVTQNQQASEANLDFSSTAQKTYAVFENVEENIFELLENVAGISVSVNDRNASFSETLPDKPRKNNFDKTMEIYKRFALGQISEVDLNINDDTIDLSILQIAPYDINYMHSSAAGKGWRNNTDVFIAPKTINFTGYFVVVTLKNQTYDSIITDYKACSGQCVQAITFDLRVLNANKILEAGTSHSNLDPFKKSTVTIRTSGGAQNDVVVTIGADGTLRVENKNSVPINVTTGVLFSGNDVPFIKLPENLVSVADKIRGHRKNS